MGQPRTQQGTITVSASRLVFGQVQSNGKRVNKSRNDANSPQGSLFSDSSSKKRSRKVRLPAEDNTPEGLRALLAANRQFREVRWPAPFNKTRHQLHLGDARELSWIPDGSVHLVVTSPPYWTLKGYAAGNANQMGHFEEYEYFLSELDRVWRECARVLAGGGRICCVVGDVCIARKKQGRHFLVPLHADIEVRARRFGLDCLQPIIWHKIANGATEVQGNGSGFYGKPYQPGAIIKNDVEYVLFLRKGGEYRSVPVIQKALSMLTREEMKAWQRSIWTDLRGASTREGHPAPYPVELAERLIKLFSFAGDTVLDPFAGTGSTSMAAIMSGRNSIANEIEPSYIEMARKRIGKLAKQPRMVGATEAEVIVDGEASTERIQAVSGVPAHL
ncbi:MAG TPA: site-specific DNA-methyltransferase [Bryobacteraceae bacterium]|nr:site-specific DNA-methyltransferase [Bryobacteraceae bacterium]